MSTIISYLILLPLAIGFFIKEIATHRTRVALEDRVWFDKRVKGTTLNIYFFTKKNIPLANLKKNTFRMGFTVSEEHVPSFISYEAVFQWPL